MRALVVSGGGSYGAYAVGVLHQLLERNSYDIAVGTSTGSLIVPLALLHDIDTLVEAYSTTGHDDIFSSSPYRVSKGERKGLRVLPVLWRVLRGSRSLGRSKNLEKTIRRHLDVLDYAKLQKLDKKCFICVANLSNRRTEYITTNESYNDFVKMMHASCSVPPFMDVIEYKNKYYVDGGVAEQVPIQKAIEEGATHIDVIVLSSKHRPQSHNHVSNFVDVISNSIGMMMQEVMRNDIKIGQLKAKDESVKINLIYRPNLGGDSLVFYPPNMKKWIEKGKQYNLSQADTYTVATNGRVYNVKSEYS